MIFLKQIKDPEIYMGAMEREIKRFFKKEVYAPLMAEIAPQLRLTNSIDDLIEAIKTGRIQFYRGTFSGRFNAQVSKELKALGAAWDRKTRTWKLSQSSLPLHVKLAIHASTDFFSHRIQKLDKKLSQIIPEQIAGKLQLVKKINKLISKLERDFSQSFKGIAVVPSLSRSQIQELAKYWQNELRKSLKDWTQKEVVELRKKLNQSVFTGTRYETLTKIIQRSYGASVNQAKFIAKQKTRMLISKFKEVKYKDTGVNKFVWKCVTGTPAHPVRPEHKALDGKLFTWDDPREIDVNGKFKSGGSHKPGDNQNPGEPYWCRCYAKPVAEFRRSA